MKHKPIDIDDTESNEDWIKEVTKKRKAGQLPENSKDNSKEKSVK